VVKPIVVLLLSQHPPKFKYLGVNSFFSWKNSTFSRWMTAFFFKDVAAKPFTQTGGSNDGLLVWVIFILWQRRRWGAGISQYSK